MYVYYESLAFHLIIFTSRRGIKEDAGRGGKLMDNDDAGNHAHAEEISKLREKIKMYEHWADEMRLQLMKKDDIIIDLQKKVQEVCGEKLPNAEAESVEGKQEGRKDKVFSSIFSFFKLLYYLESC
jgi:hypothetical protein